MRKFIFVTILAVLFLVPSLASALIGTRNLEEDIKLQQICMQVPAQGNQANGTDGVVFRTTTNSVAAPTSAAGSATAPSTFSWPAKLNVVLVDGGTATTNLLTCTSVVITGKNQFGVFVSETVSTITETAQATTAVFGVVDSVLGAGCAEGADDADVLVIRQSLELGLPVKIARASDIESACIADLSDESSLKCARLDNGGADDITSALELSTHSIDAGTAMFGNEGSEVAAALDDILCLRVRSSKTTGY